ncbi:MAG TPA: hypothetical protein VLT33_33595 [Labilithrix sp.]|nr:hypothetical protein [Labilithrix sp.]
MSKHNILSLPVLGTVLAFAASGHAQSIIKNPGDHPTLHGGIGVRVLVGDYGSRHAIGGFDALPEKRRASAPPAMECAAGSPSVRRAC